MSRKVKIGIVQLRSKLADVQFNVEKAKTKIRESAAQGAQIVCLPELFATGYDLSVMKSDVHRLSSSYMEYIKRSMSEVAKENSVYVIAPFGSVKEDRSILYNSAFIFDDNGKLLGEYSKSHLWDQERLYFEEGSEYPVFETKYGKIGILICYDAGFPEASRALCLKGAEIVFYPSAWRELDEDIWDLNLRQRALENIFFTAGVNSFDPSESVQLFGKSKVCNPRGMIIQELPKNEEACTVVEIDLDEVEGQRKKIPYLRDRKPKLYEELVK